MPTASLGSPVSLSLGAQGSCAQHPTLHPLCLCLSRLQQPCLVLGHCCAVTNVLAQLSPFFFFPLLILIAACTQQEPSLTHNPPGRSSGLTSGALLDVELLRQKPRLPQYPVTPQGDLLFNQGLSADCREGNPFGKRWPRSKAGDRSQIWSRKKKKGKNNPSPMQYREQESKE